MTPLRKAITPPALVDTMPPIVAEPRAARSTPGSSRCSREASCSASRVTPAPTTATRSTGSSRSMRFMRIIERTISPGRETLPPTRPVRPPCGTIGISFWRQMRTTAATSAVDKGATTMPAPQSAPFEPRSIAPASSPVRTFAAPTTSRIALITDGGTAWSVEFICLGDARPVIALPIPGRPQSAGRCQPAAR